MTSGTIAAPDLTQSAPYVSRYSIGGSDVGAILGVSRFSTAEAVYDRLIAAADGTTLPSKDSGDMERGRVLEGFAVGKFAAATGHTVQALETAFATSAAGTPLHANLDRGITSGPLYERFGGPGVLEIKIPRLAGFRAVKDVGVEPSYLVQVQHYMTVDPNLSWAQFGFFNAEEWQLYVPPEPTERDATTCDMITEKLDAFWTNHIVPRVRPTKVKADPKIIDLLLTGSAKTATRVSMKDPVWKEALSEWRDAKEKLTLAAAVEESAKTRIADMITAAGETKIQVPGVGKVSIVPGTNVSFDYKRLAAEHPTLKLDAYFNRTSYTYPRATFGRAEEE